jgi:glycosyltransferase involved in cell wall biosynthesis
MSSHPLIHVWIPDYESAMGGIQVFSQFFIRALGDCLPAARVTVLSKNDDSFPEMPRRVGRTDFHCSGWWPTSLRTPAFTCQLVTRALRERPNLILSTHVNFTPAARWLKRMTRVRYAAVAHGVDVWGPRRRGLVDALRHADCIWAVSRFTRQRVLADMALDPARVQVLPNTVDSDLFTPARKPRYLLKRFGLNPNQPVILTISRLASAERYKGYDQVLRALPEIRRMVPNVRYIIGGRGPDRPRIERLARDLNLDGAVSFAGYIPDHELCDFYNLCDVFAMPSKGEGFGIVFLEALACGKPVLAGNKDGSVDALLGGELGVLVDPDNTPEITAAISAMLIGRHPLAILREPEKLRAQVIEMYGYLRFTQRLAALLAELGFGSVAERVPVSDALSTGRDESPSERMGRIQRR